MKKLFSLILALMFVFMLGACGKDEKAPSAGKGEADNASDSHEEYFIWQQNFIDGLTDEGKKQETIVIPAKCEGIINGIFYKSNVKHVKFEDDDDIDIEFAFRTSDSLETVELPGNLSAIPNSTFSYCKNLKKIVIPASVTKIGASAFTSCDSLAEVVFEGTGIKTIEHDAFFGCNLLSKIEIPEGVEVIERNAFKACENLSNVKIPTTLKKIQESSFVNSPITELHFPEELVLEEIDSTAFGAGAFTMKIYVKAGSWCDLNREVWGEGLNIEVE